MYLDSVSPDLIRAALEILEHNSHSETEILRPRDGKALLKAMQQIRLWNKWKIGGLHFSIQCSFHFSMPPFLGVLIL